MEISKKQLEESYPDSDEIVVIMTRISTMVYAEPIKDNRTVKLTMIDTYLEPGLEYTYAWYVYCNGERLKEYNRWYSADPEYDLIRAEDGEYLFKLSYRVGGVGKRAS